MLSCAAQVFYRGLVTDAGATWMLGRGDEAGSARIQQGRVGRGVQSGHNAAVFTPLHTAKGHSGLVSNGGVHARMCLPHSWSSCCQCDRTDPGELKQWALLLELASM